MTVQALGITLQYTLLVFLSSILKRNHFRTCTAKSIFPSAEVLSVNIMRGRPNSWLIQRENNFAFASQIYLSKCRDYAPCQSCGVGKLSGFIQRYNHNAFANQIFLCNALRSTSVHIIRGT